MDDLKDGKTVRQVCETKHCPGKPTYNSRCKRQEGNTHEEREGEGERSEAEALTIQSRGIAVHS
jgi:hypothetical protein